MKWLLIASALVMVVCYKAAVWAQAGSHSRTCQTTSVTSATIPTSVMAPQQVTEFIIQNSSSPAADTVRVFPYTGGAAPTAVPSPDISLEVQSGNSMSDAVNCSNPSCAQGMGQGWAAYLAGGSTATTVRACWR